jgi:hypothetical protein
MSSGDLSRGLPTLEEFQVLLHDHSGLDLTNLDETTDAEREAFRANYRATFGYDHVGLNFWLEHDPAVLKRYRLWWALNMPARPLVATGFLTLYALLGYVDGVKYVGFQKSKNKAASMEQLAIAFLHCGPAGMDTIAKALEGIEWPEVDEPLTYREPYLPDPEAFSTGIDFSSPLLTEDELERIRDWYVRVHGEVPGHVDFLAATRPSMLKAYRNRIENMLRVLPKQALPLSLLHFNIMRGHAQGIRENLLWSRGFGVLREDLLNTIGNALIFAGTEGASLVSDVGGDIVSSWPDDQG